MSEFKANPGAGMSEPPAILMVDDMPAKEAKAKKAARPARKSAAKKASGKSEAAE